MPRTPRLFISGKIYEICFRTEEGLPLVCTPYMDAILKGILVTAFSNYKVDLVSFIVMGNHLHMHIRVVNPEHVDDLVCYIKRESAHAINNLLGRKRRTVWLEGYDAVIVLDFEKMVERFAYVFLNATRANLETTIDLYPGLNSWSSICSDVDTLRGRRIPREKIPALPSSAMSLDDQQQLTEALLRESLPEQQIQIKPFAVIEAFHEAKHLTPDAVRDKIIRRVREQEQRLNRSRQGNVLGAHALRLASMCAAHVSKKFGRKMWCFGSTQEIRRGYIDWFKERIAETVELKKLLSRTEYIRNLPSGFFAPGGCLHANMLPAAVPI